MMRSAVAGAFLRGGPEAAADTAHRRLHPLVIRGDGMTGELVGVANRGDAAPQRRRPGAGLDVMRKEGRDGLSRSASETSPPKAISASDRGRCRAAGCAALCSAQAYPSRPVHWIVSFAVGGPNDIVARIVGQYLSDHLGQQFIIENRPGAGGNVGMQSVLSSAPDGYTIAFVGPNYAINPTLYDKLPFNFIRDSAPVAGLIRLANVMEVHSAVRANNVAEFIAYAKANPGKINFASGGVGTSPHLSGELLK
jgi:hypothetical protein